MPRVAQLNPQSMFYVLRIPAYRKLPPGSASNLQNAKRLPSSLWPQLRLQLWPMALWPMAYGAMALWGMAMVPRWSSVGVRMMYDLYDV